MRDRAWKPIRSIQVQAGANQAKQFLYTQPNIAGETHCPLFSNLHSRRPASSSSFSQAAEKLSLMRLCEGVRGCLGPMGSCSSSTERLPFKHTHLLTNSDNGLHGCQLSEFHTLTPLPPLGPLADIKEPLFTHTGIELTGPKEAGLPRVSSIHHCPMMDN
ncbi:hypothetical protein NQZ68_025813 [Dissostichus eleginoides]|nr:hypothetical protein NQZ68_025813 [Dissostichus eleginoides]